MQGFWTMDNGLHSTRTSTRRTDSYCWAEGMSLDGRMGKAEKRIGSGEACRTVWAVGGYEYGYFSHSGRIQLLNRETLSFCQRL